MITAAKTARFWCVTVVISGLISACGAAVPSPTTAAGGIPTGCSLPLLRFDGTSMLGTINDGDLLCTVGPPKTLQRGEIVAFHPPDDPSRLLVKRVIGLPGEALKIDGTTQPTHVLIKPSGASSFELLQERYLPQAWTTLNFCCRDDGSASSVATSLTLPPDEFFVMGDNRNFSSDSRSFGLVPRPEITALITSDRSNARLYAGMPTLVPIAS